jgi:hypothetical protein
MIFFNPFCGYLASKANKYAEASGQVAESYDNQMGFTMKLNSEFDSSTGLPRPEANRWHERVLMVAVVAAMLLSLIGFVHR